jgi:hypothetical protein
MQIKFNQTVQYESEGRNKGPVYAKDSVHDFTAEFAQRWLQRGVAVEFDPSAPIIKNKPPGPPPPSVGGVEIPAEWASLGWFQLAALSAKIAGAKPANKLEAVKTVEDELARRSAPAGAE